MSMEKDRDDLPRVTKSEENTGKINMAEVNWSSFHSAGAGKCNGRKTLLVLVHPGVEWSTGFTDE